MNGIIFSIKKFLILFCSGLFIFIQTEYKANSQVLIDSDYKISLKGKLIELDIVPLPLDVPGFGKVFVYDLIIKLVAKGQSKPIDICVDNYTNEYHFRKTCKADSQKIDHRNVRNIRLVSSQEIGSKLQEQFTIKEKELYISEFLRKYVLTPLTLNHMSVCQKPLESPGFIETNYFLLPDCSKLSTLLDYLRINVEELTRQKRKELLYLSFFNTHFATSSIHELRKIQDKDFKFSVNGFVVYSDKVVTDDLVKIINKTFEHGEDLEITLLGNGFQTLESGKTITVHYKDWKDYISGNDIMLEEHHFASLLGVDYDLLIEQAPETATGILSDVKINDQALTRIWDKKKNRHVHQAHLILKSGDDLLLEFDGSQHLISPNEWKVWIKDGVLSLPWDHLEKSGVFSKTITLRISPELIRDFGDINWSYGIGISPSNVNNSRSPIQFVKKDGEFFTEFSVLKNQEYDLVFKGNEVFKKDERLTLHKAWFDNGSATLDFDNLEPAFKFYQRLDYVSKDGEKLPDNLPVMVFEKADGEGLTPSPEELAEEAIKNHRIYKVVAFENGNVILERKTKKFSIDRNCSKRLSRWVDRILVVDSSFVRTDRSVGYELDVPDSSVVLHLKQTNQKSGEVKFYLKPAQRGFKYPEQSLSDSRGEYISTKWHKTTNRIGFESCVEELKPVEIVYFDVIEGMDIDLYQRKINQLKQDQKMGKIKAYCLVFGYQRDHLQYVRSDLPTYEQKLRDQYEQGNQDETLNRSYREDPLPFSILTEAISHLDALPEYQEYFIKKTAFLALKTQYSLKDKEIEAFDRLGVDLEFFQKN